MLIEAPRGYGKSLALRRLLDQVQQPVFVSTFAEFREHVAAQTPARTPIIDGLEGWTSGDRNALTALLGAAGSTARCVIACRACPPALFDVLVLIGTKVVTTDELRLSADMTDQLLSSTAATSAKQRQILVELVDGWPWLADRILRYLASDARPSPSALSINHPAVLEVVHATLDELDPGDLALAEQLSHIESFTAGVADALAPGLLARLRAAGIPIERQADGRLQFISSIRQTLRMRSRLEPASAQLLATALHAAGLPTRAALVLVRTGQAREAAAMLTGLPFGQIEAELPGDVLMTLDLLHGQVGDHRRLLLIRANTLGLMARLDEQLDVIEQAIALAADVDDTDVLLEARAEQLFLRALRMGDAAELIEEIDELMSIAVVRGVQISTRLLEARSLALAQSDLPRDLDEAIVLSQRAVESWVALGEYGRAATALRLQAMTTLIPLGHYVEADLAVDRALSLSPGTTLDRLRSLVVSCRVAALQGENDHERLSEAAALASAHDLDWAKAYVHWAAALLAGVERRADDAWTEFERAWERLGELRNHATGAMVLAEVTEALCRAGDSARARELLERARPRREQADHEFALAELAIAARSGVDDIAELAAAGEQALRARPGLLWRIDMYRGVAAASAGRDDAAWWYDRAAAASGASGADIVDRFERQWFDARTREHAARTVPTAPPASAHDVSDRSRRWASGATVQIQVLGTFSVTRDEEPVALPGARSEMLVKTLALCRGRVAIEVMCDRLWPDVLEDVARRRLKNVLARTRQTLGDVIVRDRDHLRFAPEVALDIRAFSEASRASTYALATDVPAAIAMALQALATYRGPLLPDDLYDDNIASQRLVESGRAMALVDALLARSEDAVIAPVLLEAVLRIDPEDYERLRTLAVWADARGHAGVASSASSIALAIADELGFAVPKELELLATTTAAGVSRSRRTRRVRD